MLAWGMLDWEICYSHVGGILKSMRNGAKCCFACKNYREIIDRKEDVVFDHGDHVIYDVEEDIKTIPEFAVLVEQPGLFENAQIDESRTCVYWDDMVDLPSDTILEYGANNEKSEE